MFLKSLEKPCIPIQNNLLCNLTTPLKFISSYSTQLHPASVSFFIEWAHTNFFTRMLKGIYVKYILHRTSLVAQMVKRLPAMWETWVPSLGWEDLLEKEMATHSSTLAWTIPRTEEPGRLQSMGSQRVGHDWATSLSLSRIDIKIKWEGLTWWSSG